MKQLYRKEVSILVMLHMCNKSIHLSAVIAELPDLFVYRPKTSYVNYPHGKREDFVELAMFVE